MRSRHLLLLALLVLPISCQTAVPPEDFGPIGSFALTERNGSTVTDSDLRGKVWVASFVFTRCTSTCPQVTRTMSQLQGDLLGNQDVRLVTFTVDPERDDAKELERYAQHFEANPERWLFLTGKEDEIHKLLNKGFKVGVERRKGDKVKPGDEFEHSTRLVVVDRKGHIRGYFSGLFQPETGQGETEFQDNLESLKRTVAVLLREAP